MNRPARPESIVVVGQADERYVYQVTGQLGHPALRGQGELEDDFHLLWQEANFHRNILGTNLV
jgi:hypothetical protein